jgi:hypothetical protein
MKGPNMSSWVVVVSCQNEAGETETFVASEGFASQQQAEDFVFGNASAYASDWLVEVATAEEAEHAVTQ